MNRHPDDAFIFELDLDENSNMKYDPETGAWKFTDRAKKAQAAVRSRFLHYIRSPAQASCALEAREAI